MAESPEEILECVGYYGFGGGWVAGQMKLRGQAPTGDNYCVGCPLATVCWKSHEERVRTMFPKHAEAVDALGAMTGLHGMVLHHEFERRYRQPDAVLSVMHGNVEDGLSVGEGQMPADRGRFSLPYPFKSSQRN